MRPFPHSEIDLALDAANFGTRYVADIPREHMARLLDDPAAAGLGEEPTRDLTPEEWRFELGVMLGMAVFAVLFLFWLWGQA